MGDKVTLDLIGELIGESNLQYSFFLEDVITGLIALSPFDCPFSPPGHPYLLPPASHIYLIL